MADGPIRIKDKDTGHEYTVGALSEEDKNRCEVLDKPAVNPDGRWLPPVYAEPKSGRKTTEAAK